MSGGLYDEREGCVTCETRGPKWCDEHAHLLIADDPRVPSTSEGEGA